MIEHFSNNEASVLCCSKAQRSEAVSLISKKMLASTLFPEGSTQKEVSIVEDLEKFDEKIIDADTSKIDSIFRNSNSLFLIYKDKERHFDKIVVAAGVWSNILAKTIGDNFPLDTERGYHILFENDNNLLNQPVGWAKTGIYMTPMEGGIRVAGTVEIAGLRKPMNNHMLSMIEETARSILPQLGAVKSQWMGFRPPLPDSLPVIGESKKCKNVYYAFGHQHLGLSLAAVTGKVIQSLIEKQPTNINIDSLSPYRF